MRLIPLILVTVAIFGIVLSGSLKKNAAAPAQLRALKMKHARRPARGVDHAKLAALQKPFGSGPEVTSTCLSCHNETHKGIQVSSHWMWERTEYVAGQGLRAVGKKNALNNYCIGVSSNLEGCDKCHAGYGYKDAKYDFSDPTKIDCLVCHDTTGTYAKGNGGLPAAGVDLTAVARKVGRPSRGDCGACHFYGGGGNNVKHGDLEMALETTTREVDVHMGTDGGDLDCVACHVTENHRITGKLYSVSSMNRGRVTCEQCHGGTPHADDMLNEHTVKVACQTCHIPEYAKANATKMAWDWSTAGRLENGQPVEKQDKDGNILYASIKGDFTWAKNVKPEYVFFNGTAEHLMLGDKVGAARPVQVNQLNGWYGDAESKITPVKVHRGKQAYDPVNQLLIQPRLWGKEKGEGAFWKDFDWQAAAREGMKISGLPYSGKMEFVKTEMYWPVNHMVAPKEKSLTCESCHARRDSRMAGLGGFYMPGRDRNELVDVLGWLSLGGVLAGVLAHGGARVMAARRRRAA